jgi:hypothetical protein
MNMGGFSWRRLLGISAFKARISRTIGIPLTKSGREQKVGRFFYRVLKVLVLVLVIYLFWRWLLL